MAQTIASRKPRRAGGKLVPSPPWSARSLCRMVPVPAAEAISVQLARKELFVAWTRKDSLNSFALVV